MPLEILSAQQTILARPKPEAYWPTQPDQQGARLTPMCLPALRPSFSIAKDDLIFTIGSCFARNIEKQLMVEGFNVAANRLSQFADEEGVNIPHDILNKFVVGSIFNEMKWGIDPDSAFDNRTLVQVGSNNRYVDMNLAPGMTPAALETVSATRRAVSRYMAMIKDAKVVIITLGLAEGWFDRTLGIYLNRAPQKMSAASEPGRFELHVLSYEDIASSLEDIVALIKRHGRPDSRILLTVSPVALGMTWTDDDALIANCYSKSVQRAAASYICKKYDFIDYIPTYESITLSDRRMAWRADAAHVSDEAVRMNVLRMMYAYTGIQGSEEADQKRAVALQLVRDAETATLENRPADAMRATLIAKETAPDEVAVRHKLGTLLAAEGRLEEAVEELGVALKLGGSRYGSSEQLGLALMRLGRPGEAIPHLEEAVALRLKRSKAPRLLGEAYAAAGDPEKGVSYLLETVLPASEKKAGAAYSAAVILFKLGRYDQAAPLVDLALSEVPDHPKYQGLQTKLSSLRTTKGETLLASAS